MHLADLHLGAPFSYLGDKAGQRVRELESALMRALSLVPQMNVDAVVVAGDLFDRFDPPAELVTRVKAAFHKTAENGVPIVLIPGTHDSHRYARSVFRQEKFPGVDILLETGTSIGKTLNGHRVYFYGYPGIAGRGRDAYTFKRDERDGIHVALVHGSVLEGTHWSSSPRDFSLKPDDVKDSGFDYVALGHHHNFREYRYGKLSAVYPGTLEGMKFGEEGDRFLVIAVLDENGTVLEKTKHNHRALSRIQIDLSSAGIDSADSLIEIIQAHADPSGIVKVLLSGTSNFFLRKEDIRAQLADRFFHLEIEDDTSTIESGMIRSLANEDTVRGIFVRKMVAKLKHSSPEHRQATELALRLGIEQFLRARNENT
jgi:exonuclease SbcD